MPDGFQRATFVGPFGPLMRGPNVVTRRPEENRSDEMPDEADSMPQ